MDSDDEETFVTVGTPLELFDEDEIPKKPVSAHEKRERGRFHGAFTGGFSAGYFNTVGSKDGFTPSTFVSSREKKSEVKAQMPEDFMDEEDLGKHGIAPRKLKTSSVFSSEERRKRRFDEAKAATSGTLFCGTAAITDLILPQKMTIGIKLLRSLGWKEGQGIGPRTSRTKRKQMTAKQESVSRIYGCSLPPQQSSDEESEEDMEGVTFAPKDVNPITFDPKTDVHGIGYRGLNPSLALPSSHINLFEPPPITKTGKKGIRGQAFGVGALEEDDDNIYSVDHLSNYDISRSTDDIEDESEVALGWTAPGLKKRSVQPPSIGYVGKVLEGFTLSSNKTLEPKKPFPPPHIPATYSYKPKHQFRKKFSKPEGGDGSTTLSDSHNAVSRGLVLGETPIIKSVFDLVSKEDLKKMERAKQTSHTLEHQPSAGSYSDTSSAMATEKVTPRSSGLITENGTPATLAKEKVTPRSSGLITENRTPAKAPATMAKEKVTPRSSGFITDNRTPVTAPATMATEGVTPRSSEPMFKGSAKLFQPFSKNPQKQERYERYLAFVKHGHKDAYPLVAESHMTEWEREHEEAEFSQAANLYKPMSGMIASRFTRAKYRDDETNVEGLQEAGKQHSHKSDQVKAAEMKMYGSLTRETLEWHPHLVVCKRFNVANPYPGSSIVGLIGSRKDKISIFNFLDFSGPDEYVPEEHKALLAPPVTETAKEDQEKKQVSFRVQSHNKQLPVGKSIFSGLLDEEDGKKKGDREKKKEEDRRKEKGPASQSTKEGTVDSEHKEEEKSTTQENLMEIGEEDKPPMDLFEAIFGESDSEEEKKEGHSIENVSTTAPEPTAEESTTGATERPKEHERSNLLPGAPVPIETVEERLSPMATEEAVEEEYGPALPPSFSNQGPSKDQKTNNSHTTSASQRKSVKHWTEYKEKNKHKHKKEKKSKKSKHKKSDRKKSKKKKKDHVDSDYEASGSSDSEDNEENVPSNREILSRLKSLSSDGKLSAKNLIYDKHKR